MTEVEKVALAAAKDEWAQVEAAQAQGPPPSAAKAQPIKYDEALAYLKALDYKDKRSQIVVEDPSASQGCCGCFGKPPALEEKLTGERDLLFLIAKWGLKEGDEAQNTLLLQTAYANLMACELCPGYGAHWETIGFQGPDPSTDLRGVGMLGALQLLYISEHHQHMSRDILKLSQDPTQRFPLAAVSLNLTRMVLESARAGSLTAVANARGAFLDAANSLFCAEFHALYRIWVDGKKTVTDMGFVLKDIGNRATKSAAAMIREFEKSPLYSN
eukprot:m51a1_g4553 hypothetical protein (272) ;mRNA; f:81417-82612